VLTDYVYRESIELSPFRRVLEDVFEGGLEGMGGALISVLAALRSLKFGSAAAVSSTHIVEGSRRDAAMRGHRSVRYAKALSEASAL
jgi:hypothetical protein